MNCRCGAEAEVMVYKTDGGGLPSFLLRGEHE